VIRSAHDCAEGGVAITLAECCIGTGLGAQIDVAAATSAGPNAFADIATLFSESPSRVVISCAPAAEADLVDIATRRGVSIQRIGVVGGTRVQAKIDGRSIIDESLPDIERTWNTAIERYFEPARAIA
jgi:phosphoribosylformylglycinamidine synthase